MLNKKNAHNINPFINISENVSKGYYMNSIIAPDSRAKCSLCKGDSFKLETFDLKMSLAIAVCRECGAYPDKIRIRRSLPIGQKSEAERVDIRFSKIGERIKDIEEAKHIARSIDYDIKSGRFDPNDYRPKKQTANLIFKNFIANKYLPIQMSRLSRGEITPGGMKAKRSSISHLVKYFGEFDIRNISSGAIEEYFQLFPSNKKTSGTRARDLSIIELKVIMAQIFRLGTIKELPTFPKIKKAKLRDVERFLTDQEQELILSKIDNPLYRIMIEVLIIYAMRPCEVRALQWRDLDFKNDIITVSRHFSDGVHIREGRKSNEGKHYLPMIPRFRELIATLPRSIKNEDFIFKGRCGGAVADRVMARHWAIACKKAKIDHVQLYEGTKHSRLSSLKKLGYTDSELILVSGHTNEDTVKRYAQVTKLNRLEKVREMIQ